MHILYIGQYQTGSTSRMRGEQLKKLIPNCNMQVINTHIPFENCNRLFRSLGFRYKRGPLVANTNQFIRKQFAEFPLEQFDLIWIDKAVYITKATTALLREKAKTLVHFTPDMAFYGNKSVHFTNSLPFYDYVITTKTKEIPIYQKTPTILENNHNHTGVRFKTSQANTFIFRKSGGSFYWAC